MGLGETKPEPTIFWCFIREERNNLLKKYKFGANVGTTIEVPTAILKRNPDGTIEQVGTKGEGKSWRDYNITDGPFKGKDQREVKVDEPFGQLVRDWNDGSEGKVRRLNVLLEVLKIDPSESDGLRYQLFHRTAASIFEAQRYGAGQALMLVHSFSPADASFDDFVRFAKALGTPIVAPNNVSSEVNLGGVRLRLGWVRDKPRD
ncbi:MAG: hypothetical protein IH793_11790 [Acidobacteria bacterium]|nr:hypothetical protein [Acidobacteriota bacterium]